MANETPREIAVMILLEIYNNNAYNNIVLHKYFNQYSELTSLDKSFITELVNGTVKNQRHLDYIIDQFSNIKTKKMKPWIRNILRIGVYQIKFLSKVPPSAACNEAVNITKKRGYRKLSGFVNGVLRNISRNIEKIKYPSETKTPIEYLCTYYSYPEWIIKMWLQDYPYAFVKELCEAGNQPPDITVRCNSLKTTVEELAKELKEDQIQVSPGYYVPDALHLSKTSDISEIPAFKEGLFQIQDESSMLVGNIVDPLPGEYIIDVCSAPGGKATHLAEIMKNKGKILARDVHVHKLDLINESARRLGIKIIKTEIFDASNIDTKNIGKADRVVIDAPCSGFGIIRKKPDIKWQRSLKDIDNLVTIQRNILAASAQYVKPGGILVYSTCTINSRENIENIQWFLQKFPFELEDITPYLPVSLAADGKGEGYLQLFPHVHNIDGFFIARLKRSE